MKISEKQYARSLYQAVEGKSKTKVKQVIKNFIEILARDNKFSRADAIINEFIKIWNEKNKIVEAEVVGARELNSDIIISIKKYILEMTKVKEVSLTRLVDKNILGGVIIKYGDKVLDGSLKGRLEEMKKVMMK